MVDYIRVSEGTGAVLRLWDRKLTVFPKTGYLMTYRENGCIANCRFCPQANSDNSDSDRLSRVSWPKTEFEKFLQNFSKNHQKLDRICIQALNYNGVISDILDIVSEIRKDSNIPISVSCQPLKFEDMKKLYDSGVDRLGIPLDASTGQLFDSIKGESANGPYRWKVHIQALEKAGEIFGENVSTHLIVGLGESDRDIVEMIQSLHDKDITIALFAFTPVKGSDMEDIEKPSVERYRKIQLSHYLITRNIKTVGDMVFKNEKLIDFDVSRKKLKEIIFEAEPFRTSGCPGCDRPFYNESVTGPIYNFPEKPNEEDLEKITVQIMSELEMIW